MFQMIREVSAVLLATVCCQTCLVAQIGGNGSQGVFDPPVSLTIDTAINQGVYHFTRIHIRAGITVTLRGTLPAIFLSQGPVVIDGCLDASGGNGMVFSSTPGAGGYAGGAGGNSCSQAGQGPGGGSGACGTQANPYGVGGHAGHARRGSDTSVPGGAAYGSSLPFDLRGGSGGGGSGIYAPGGFDFFGGAGGGTIVILSDDTIRVTGMVLANGGAGTFSGHGSGGAILLRAINALDVSGAVEALGVQFLGMGSSAGFVRLESYQTMPSLTGTVAPIPLAGQLPALHADDPSLATGSWRLQSPSLPGDVISFFISAAPASIPLPPAGTIEIDPRVGFHLAAVPVPAAGHDPIASLTLPVPMAPGLIGTPLYLQAFNFTSVIGSPRLTNSLMRTVQP